MTNSTPDNAYIQRLLEQWGWYCRQVSPTHLGYPTHSACAPPSPGCGGGDGLTEQDEQQARQLDRILAGLKQQDRQAWRSLEQIYLWRVSAVEAAARLGVSRRALYTLRGRGEAYIAGAFMEQTEIAA